MRKSRCYPPRCAPKPVIGSMGQKKRVYSSSSAAGGSSGSLSIKSAPCSILAGRDRRHAPNGGNYLLRAVIGVVEMPKAERYPHKVGNSARLHLLYDRGPVMLGRPRADP